MNIALFLAWLSVCLALPGSAQPQPAPPLRVAMSGDYPPLHARSDGSFVGFEPDLAALIAEHLGRELVMIDARALGTSSLGALAAGEADIAMNAITVTPARQATVDFTRPYVTLRYRLAGKGEGHPYEEVKLASLDDTIAAGSELVAGALSAAAPRATIVRFPSMDAALQAFYRGEIEWIAAEDVGLANTVSRTRLVVRDPPFGASPIAIAAPPGGAGPYDEAIAVLAPAIEALRRRWRPGAPDALPRSRVSLVGRDLLEQIPASWAPVWEREHGRTRVQFAGMESDTIHLDEDQIFFADIDGGGIEQLYSVARVGGRLVFRTSGGTLRLTWPASFQGHQVGRWQLPADMAHMPHIFVPPSSRAFPILDECPNHECFEELGDGPL